MDRIYLDANATTPVLPEVVEAMRPFWSETFGNPSSAHHAGQRTRSAVERARMQVAALLHCSAKELVFTCGGTEGDNLALSGVLQPYLDRNEPAHLITTAIEHHAVLHAAESLEARGIEVTYLAPSGEGVIAAEHVKAALRPHTRLVSVMLANNETGAVQPLAEVARLAKDHGALVHTDAVQGAGKLPLDLSGELQSVDLLTLSGHKMYAPPGTGALFVRKGVSLAPLFHGGPHERQRRAGTENVPGIVGLGKAAELATKWLEDNTERCEPKTFNATGEQTGGESLALSASPATLFRLRNHLEQALLTTIPHAHVNAATAQRVPNTTNIRFDDIEAEALLIALDMQGIAASFGAACMSGATEPSHVLLSMGLTVAEARSSLRLSLSRLTSRDHVERAISIIPAAVARLRALS